jgi:hypothetical protein
LDSLAATTTSEPGRQAPAQRYARLNRAACEAELARRRIHFTTVGEARGVLEPERFEGPLHGVTYRTALAESKRASSPLEIVDCRLALSLDDFAGQLAAHDIVEVVHYSIYRPPSARWPPDKIAKRHPGGLAIDAEAFVKRSGEVLSVERDFHGRIGAPTCTAHAAEIRATDNRATDNRATDMRPTPQAIELRKILCDAAEAKLFTVELSPNYNWAHRNHFHLEVTAGARWFLVH